HDAELCPVPDEVHPAVREALARRGIEALFSHQEEAWDSVMRRGHMIVTTGTASGKSLCFNLPVLHMLSTDPRARALYLYPTKAPIANPVDLASGLTGLEFGMVDRDGAPRGEREIVMANPPLLDERTGRRASSLSEAAALFADLVDSGVRTICFARSRRAAELIYQFAKNRLDDRELERRIAPYRAGYTPQQRRELERRLAEGELLGVV